MTKELHIGRVVEVTGYSVTGQLEGSVDDLYRNHESRRYAVGQVGSIVKIEVGDRLVFGFVTRMRMFEEVEALRLRSRFQAYPLACVSPVRPTISRRRRVDRAQSAATTSN